VLVPGFLGLLSRVTGYTNHRELLGLISALLVAWGAFLWLIRGAQVFQDVSGMPRWARRGPETMAVICVISGTILLTPGSGRMCRRVGSGGRDRYRGRDGRWSLRGV
jgi:hypothetical protein